jgi:hypothetical protein
LPPFIVARAQVREFLNLLEEILATTVQKANSESPKSPATSRTAHAAAR